MPEPSKLDTTAEDAAKHSAIAFMVSVDAPDATVRVNITARGSQIEKIDALAEVAGMTRSGYIVRAALDNGKGSRPHARNPAARGSGELFGFPNLCRLGRPIGTIFTKQTPVHTGPALNLP